jgi:cytochrome c oxidase cbb3-type subunit 1
LFLIGGCVGAYNIWKTINTPSAVAERAIDLPQTALAGAGALQAAE